MKSATSQPSPQSPSNLVTPFYFSLFHSAFFALLSSPSPRLIARPPDMSDASFLSPSSSSSASSSSCTTSPSSSISSSRTTTTTHHLPVPDDQPLTQFFLYLAQH